jgi:peptidoglycan/xylan/chitin deacetylase (PgdA/CDA1 family)
MAILKENIKKTIASSAILTRLLGLIAYDFPKVFLYHRFSQPNVMCPHRVSADTFRWQLERIAERYQVLTFRTCVEYFMANGAWPERCAVITVDDGYRDFYEWAYPELRRLSLPATFFVTVNFVEQKLWLWPDRLHYVIENTRESALKVSVEGKNIRFQLNNQAEKFTAWKSLSDNCISLADSAKESLIATVESELGVNLPAVPPAAYAAVTWEELAEMQGNGIEIGSHTMTHPILSRISRERLVEEVVTSRVVLEKMLKAPVRTFCYPNGQPGDINDEVVAVVRDAGYIGAPFWFDLTTWDPFLVPRMGVSNDRADFMCKLGGLELAGLKLRKAFRGGSS